MNPDPPDDLEEIFRATLNQLHAEALVTPTVLTLPPEVIASITSYQKTHRIPREHLLDLALKAQKGRMESLVQACDCLMKGPDSFAWPLDDPLACVAPHDDSHLPAKTLANDRHDLLKCFSE